MSLNISYNNITKNSVISLFKFLKIFPAMAKIDLSYSSFLIADAFISIIEYLESNSSLTELNYTNNLLS